MSPLVLQSARYDGLSIAATWTAVMVETVTHYELEVRTSGGARIGTKILDPWATSGSLPLSAPLPTAEVCTFEVFAMNGQMVVASFKVQLITQLPQLQDVSYDGTEITAEWIPVLGGSVAVVSYTLRAYSPQVGPPVSVTIDNPVATNGVLELPFPLLMNENYVFEVCANGPGNVSACAPVWLITRLPELVSVSYNGSSVVADWLPAGSEGVAVAGYTLDVISPLGTVAATATIDSPVATRGVVELAAPLPTTGNYQFQLYANAANGVVSAGSRTVSLITQLPQLQDVSYDGTNITAEWIPVLGSAVPVATYALKAYSPGGGPTLSVSIDNPVATNGVLPIPVALREEDYVFEVCANAAETVSACAKVSLITQLPELLSVSYDGAAITATWAAIRSLVVPISSYTLLAYSPQGGTPKRATVNDPVATSGVLQLEAPLPAGAYRFQLYANAAKVVSAGSIPVPLINELPVLVAVSYDGLTVEASWTQMLKTDVPIASYTLKVYSPPSGTPVIKTIDNPSATHGTLELAEPLPLAGNYVFQVCANSAHITQSCSAPATLITKLPALQDVTYEGSDIAAEWIPVLGTSVPVATYTLKAYPRRGGAEISVTIENPVATNGVLEMASPLPTGEHYLFQVCANAAQVVTACTAPVSLNTQAPYILSASNDVTGVAIRWSPVAGVWAGIIGYRLIVYSPSGGNPIIVDVDDPAATSGVVPIPTPLKTTQQYVALVYARSSSDVSVGSNPASLLTRQPLVESVTYDGSTINITWTSVSEAGIIGYQCELYDGDIKLKEARVDGNDASGGWISSWLAAPLTGQGNYVILVRATGDNAVGPPSALADVISAVPEITSLVITSGNIAVEWNAADLHDANGVTGYSLGLYSDGVLQGDPVIVTGSATGSANITATLDSYKTYSVQMQAIGVNAAGPMSEAEAVFAAVPVIEAVSFDGASVNVRWTAARDSNVTGYIVTLSGSGGALPVTLRTDATQAVLPLSPVTGQTYQVTVQAISNKATGIPGTAVQVITESLTLSGVQYDGSVITAQWGAGGAGITRYELTLYDGDAPVKSQSSSQPRGAIEAFLPPSGRYSVKVAAAAPNSTGPASAEMAVITARPTITSVLTSADKVTLGWNASAFANANGVAGYSAGLYSEGILQGNPVTVTGASTGTADLPATLDAFKSYTVQVQAVGSNATSQTGPLSQAEAAIAAVPMIRQTSFDGANATIKWDALLDNAVTGYAVTLIANGQAGTTQYTSAVEITLPVDASKINTVQVQAIGNMATGRPSAGAAIITEQVSIASALFDGEFITASWTAAQTAGATYRLELYDGTSLTNVHSSDTNQTTIPARLNPGGTYSLKVRVATQQSVGQPGNAMNVISAVPGITSITTNPSDVTLVIDTSTTSGANGVAGYYAFLYQGDLRVAGPASATTSGGVTTAVIHYTLVEQYDYSVRVQAIGSNAASQAGPIGEAAGAIANKPQIIAADYDGQVVTAEWTPVLDTTVTGYKVTVFETPQGTVVGDPLYTAATAASISVTLELGKSYAVSVQAIGDISFGMVSDPANPLVNSRGFFFPANSASQYAYLFRGDIRGPGPADILVYLPELFNVPQTSPPSQDPFNLSRTIDPGDTNFPYMLTVAQNASINVWAFSGNGIRSNLSQAYIAFLKKLEAVTGGMKVGAMALVQQVIAQALPLTFEETLYYAYGFDSENGYVNLQPGMRLRIDFEQYQMVSPSAPDRYLNGFSGSGTSYFELGSMPAPTSGVATVFNSFLARMPIPDVTPNNGGAGGIIDLQGADYQLPIFRLFYPPTFPSSDSGGSTVLSQNVVLLATTTVDILDRATTRFLRFRDFQGISGIQYAFFRGRAILVPEIQCFINGTPEWVAVGTTVRQLVEQFASLPFGEAVTLGNFDYERAVGNLVDDPASVSPVYPFSRVNRVNFSFSSLSNYSYTGLDLFDMPVFQGDSLTCR